ncbi:MAG: flagellar filament protein [Legionellales bacterium]|nr:flagellar filament protein [Legionellales bacterium]
MSLGVLTNIPSLQSQAALVRADREMQTSMERLSTGLRINSASDDAAGLAMGQRLTAQVNGLNMASKNASDAQSLIDSVDGALTEVDDMLQRMRELSIQAANDTLNSTDREYLNAEVEALQAELTRISTSARFNGERILDGNLSKTFQLGTEAGETVAMTQESVAAGSLGAVSLSGDGPDVVASGIAGQAATYGFDGTADTVVANNLSTTVSTSAQDSAKTVAAAYNALTATTGVTATADTRISVVATAGGTLQFKLNDVLIAAAAVTTTSYGAMVTAVNASSGSTGVTAELASNGNSFFLIDADGDNIKIEREDAVTGADVTLNTVHFDDSLGASATLQHAGADGDLAAAAGRIKFTSNSAFNIDTGASANAKAFTGSAAAIDGAAAVLTSVDLTTRALASSSLAIIDGAIEKVGSMRASLGSLSNRLTHTIDFLTDSSAATTQALGKLQDADFAAESARLAKSQVLMQAGTAMLAQANAAPQMVLQLIQ